MSDDWQDTTLGEIAVRENHGFVDGPFGSNLAASSYVENGIPVIRGTNLSLGTSRFRSESFVYVSSETASRLSRSICRPLDIIITKKGTIGQVGLVPLNSKYSEYLLSSNQMKLTVDNNKADPLYVYYYLSSPTSREKILRDSESTGVPKTNLAYFKSFPIGMPGLKRQRHIGRVLGTLDDKIELNRQMNATLESMAQAIFMSWFIDFDPVHRNAAARSGGKIKTTSKESSYNLASDVDSFFPDSLEESDIGPIPNGWTVELLGNHASITRGLSYKGSGLADTGKPMFNLNSILEGGGYKKAGIKYYTGDYFDKHEVLPGDLLVANTEQGFDRLLIGYAAVVPEYFTDGGIYSHHVYRVRPNSNSPLTARYLERWINSPLPHEWITGYSNGTTVNMLPMDGLTNAQVLLPPREIIHEFTDIANSIAVQQQANDQASMHYSQARDLLLPQLMSGQMLNVS
jgi:type I restriction enzyme S subunit